MTRPVRSAPVVALALMLPGIGACERPRPAAPPPPSPPPVSSNPAAHEIMRRDRVPPEACDPTIALTGEVRGFLGEWVSVEEPDTEPLLIHEAPPGVVTVAYPPSDRMRSYVTNVRLEYGVLMFDTVMYWDAEGTNPLFGTEGIPMRTELHPVGGDSGRLEMRVEPKANLGEPVLMQRREAAGTN